MYVNEEFRTRILIASQGAGTAGGGYLAPTPGVNTITVRAIVNITNAANLELTLKSADDTAGNNAANFILVPVFLNGIRQSTYESAITITQDSGIAIVDFEVMPGQVPEGKTIGLAFGTSNAENIITAELLEDVAYVPSDN
jgi:hypothetical protein